MLTITVASDQIPRREIVGHYIDKCSMLPWQPLLNKPQSMVYIHIYIYILYIYNIYIYSQFHLICHQGCGYVVTTM